MSVTSAEHSTHRNILFPHPDKFSLDSPALLFAVRNWAVHYGFSKAQPDSMLKAYPLPWFYRPVDTFVLCAIGIAGNLYDSTIIFSLAFRMIDEYYLHVALVAFSQVCISSVTVLSTTILSKSL